MRLVVSGLLGWSRLASGLKPGIPSRSLTTMRSMSVEQSDGVGGEGITLLPQNGHDSVVLWMHGLGDTAAGWYSVMPGEF